MSCNNQSEIDLSFDPNNCLSFGDASSSCFPQDHSSSDNRPNSLRKRACPASQQQLLKQKAVDWRLCMSPQGLLFQLRLNTLGDLHRLLCSHFVFEKDHTRLPESFSSPQSPPRDPDQRCTLFLQQHSRYCEIELIPEKMKELDKFPSFKRKVMNHLFLIYASDCFSGLPPIPPTIRTRLLEKYYSNELSTPFLYSALAWAAKHTLVCHSNPFQQHLIWLADYFYEHAKASLEDMFDDNGIENIVASLNLHLFSKMKGHLEVAYTWLRHAIVLARVAELDRKDEGTDIEEKEFRNRIWLGLCLADVTSAVLCGTKLTVYTDELARMPRPKLLPGEGSHLRIYLKDFYHCIDTFIKLAYTPEIDWTLPDDALLDTLLRLALTLQRETMDALNAIANECPPRPENQVNCIALRTEAHFWLCWGNMYVHFLDAQVAPERLVTPAVQKLRALAFKECLKTGRVVLSFVVRGARAQNWCEYHPGETADAACWLLRRLVRIEGGVRTWVVGQLRDTTRELGCLEPDKIGIVKGLRRKLCEVIGELLEGA
ncbi:uncharacterized protein VTP21DRAFT_11432 [Calcarisporiella thermophila]|uniref:uncharacterized protein n=1 Tax=Calcarisporiella thermophila TaxID=911321 RepID=UPI003743FCA5